MRADEFDSTSRWHRSFFAVAVFFLGNVILRLSMSAWAVEVSFVSSEVGVPGHSRHWTDLDGDGLLDLCVLRGRELRVHSLSADGTLEAEPSQRAALPSREPCVLWSIPGSKASELVLLKYDGVFLASIPEEPGKPLILSPLIQSSTMIPPSGDGRASFVRFALSGKENPDAMLLVPAENGLQAWSLGPDGMWCLVRRFEQTVFCRLSGPDSGAVYRLLRNAMFAVSDLDGDGLDDLVFSTTLAEGSTRFAGFVRQSSGCFPDKPSFEFDCPLLGLERIQFVPQGKGRLPLVMHAVNPKEPWFIPGTFSAKVLVTLSEIDRDTGRLASEPVARFRKNDWSPWVPAADIDGDGEVDLLLGYLRFRGRDDFVNLLQTCSMRVSLRTHFHGPGGYRTEPDNDREVGISVERVQVQFAFEKMTTLVRRYLSLDGDFDGDGTRDLLLRSSDEDIGIFLFDRSRRDFAAEPSHQFKAERANELRVQDINGDGISDLIVPRSGRPMMVYVSHREGDQ